MECSGTKSLGMFLDEERRRSSFEGGADSQLSSPRPSCVCACASASASSLLPFQRTLCLDAPAPLYQCIASLQRNEGTIFSLTLAKDLILTGSSSNRIHAWKQPDCSEVGCIDAATGQIRAIVACGNMLVSSHGDFRIRVWNLSSSPDRFRPKKMMTLPQRRRPFFNKNADRHKDLISCLALNDADKLIYTASWDHTVKVWSFPKRCCVDSFLAHEGQVNAITVNQEDGRVFTCSSDSTVRIWRRVCKETPHILTMTLKFQPSPGQCLGIGIVRSSPLLWFIRWDHKLLGKGEHLREVQPWWVLAGASLCSALPSHTARHGS